MRPQPGRAQVNPVTEQWVRLIVADVIKQSPVRAQASLAAPSSSPLIAGDGYVRLTDPSDKLLLGESLDAGPGVPKLLLDDVWDDAVGTVERGIQLNVTDTLSSVESTLLDLVRNGYSRFNVRKSGGIVINSDDTADPAAKVTTFAAPSNLLLGRRNGTMAAPTASINGNMLGNVYFGGVTADGAGGLFEFSPIWIRGVVSAAVSAFNLPADLAIFVGPFAVPERMRITYKGSVVLNASGAALATTAVDGFTYIPTCAGVPTGVPTAFTGAAPLVINTAGALGTYLYGYIGGAWQALG